jgi:hypothetical protein
MDKAQVERGTIPHYSERGIGIDMIEYAYLWSSLGLWYARR